MSVFKVLGIPETDTAEDVAMFAAGMKAEFLSELALRDARLASQRTLVEKLVGMLRQIEESGLCPICRGEVFTIIVAPGSSRTERRIEHDRDCALAALLREVEAGK